MDMLLSFAIVTIVFASFDLWMSKGGVNTFALVIKYFDESWIPHHPTIGLFEVQKTRGSTMALQL
jgi:hypothetical protein